VTKIPEKVTNQYKINHLKKIDSSKLNNVAVVSTSSATNISNRLQESTSHQLTSSATNISNRLQESTSHQLTKHLINTEKMCKTVDSTNVAIDKSSSEISKEFLVSNDTLVANVKDSSKLDVLTK